jgi:hypothetical protein
MDKLQVRPDREKWSINSKSKQFIGADMSQVGLNQTNQNKIKKVTLKKS